MPGWRRNQRSGTPAAALAGPPPARPRDDWRALPPLPTVLRSPITTVAVGAFSEGLSTWRDPSFLAPLSHQIDPGGPSGLIAGLASTPASPEPTTYYHDHPLPLAGRRPPASLQRSAAHSGPSALTTAPDVDLGSLSRPAIPADPASATTQEPPGVAAESPALPAENLAPDAVGPAQPPEAPLVSHRDPGPVTAQRQMAPPSPQAPPPNRRLGLGAPLNSPPGGPSVPATFVSLPPVVARSAGPPPADPGGRTPRPPVLPDPGNPAAGPP